MMRWFLPAIFVVVAGNARDAFADEVGGSRRPSLLVLRTGLSEGLLSIGVYADGSKLDADLMRLRMRSNPAATDALNAYSTSRDVGLAVFTVGILGLLADGVWVTVRARDHGDFDGRIAWGGVAAGAFVGLTGALLIEYAKGRLSDAIALYNEQQLTALAQ